MCSMIGIINTPENLYNFFNNNYKTKNDSLRKTGFDILIDILDIKGGDEYGFVIGFKGMYKFFNSKEKAVEHNILSLLYELKKNTNKKIFIQGFSRLTPEMEGSSNLKQPYYNLKRDSIITVHGTIPKAEEYDSLINIDTEIFQNTKHLTDTIDFVESQNGKISLLELSFEKNNDDIIIKNYTNGLGLYEYRLEDYFNNMNIDIITNINLTKNHLDIDNEIFLKSELKNSNIFKKEKPVRIISLFSGGLDIACSTQMAIEDYLNDIKNTNGNISLWYFDWGSNAAEKEKQTLHKYAEIISNKYDTNIIYNSFDIKSIFSGILNFATGKNKTRLNSNDSTGAGSHEAEAAISYVPMRNTLLLTLAAAKAESLYPDDKCIFIIGANLSEGMIYLDNSETFINNINDTLKVAGQHTYNFEVYAPFVNFTKTKMLQIAKEKQFEIENSFSCYFPVNGEPCGECGSCILRANALKRNNI